MTRRTLRLTTRTPLLAFVLGGLLSALPMLALAQDNLPGPESSPQTQPGAAETGVLGEAQQVEVDVGEGISLVSIMLSYRFGNEQGYRELPMQESAVAGMYVASVPTSGRRDTRMEYFVVAEEAGGELLGKGSESAPLVRELRAPPGSESAGTQFSDTEPTDTEPTGESLPGAELPNTEPSGTELPEAEPPRAETQRSAAPIVSSSGASADAQEPEQPATPQPQSTSNTMKYVYYGLGILAVGALAAAAGGSSGGGDSSGGACAPAGCEVTVIAPDP